MHIRAQVRRAQSTCEPEQRPRKLSIASLSSHAWFNTKRKSFASWKQSLSNDTSSVSPRVGEDLPALWHVTPRVHSTPDLLVAPIHTDSMNSALSNTIERSSSEPVLASRRSSRFEAMHWKYARFAFLCCLVLLITWVPISIMRVYNNFIDPNHPIIGLYYASAVCIPLQGFGNFIIYLTSSWPECRSWTMNLISGDWLKEKSRVSTDNISVGV